MITFEQVEVGTRVKNICRRSIYYGLSATIQISEESYFKVKYDGGGDENAIFIWSFNDGSWFDIDIINTYYRPAINNDIKLGAKLRCIYNSGYYFGRTATITACNGTIFTVEWDDGVGGGDWYDIESQFEILTSNKHKKPKKIIPDIPLDPSLPVLQAGYLQDRMRKQFR